MSELAVRAAVAVRSPQGRGADAADPAELGYHRDLLAPFGEKPDEELLSHGAHVHHRDLADLLADDQGVGRSRPELVIVTQALPDVVPFTAVASHLNERLGGGATSFAIGQQGLAAPFTALRIAAAYSRAGRAAEVVLAVLEQTTLPTAFTLDPPTALIDSAAALVLATGEDDGSGLRFAGSHAAGSVAHALDQLPLGGGPFEDGTLLVLGPWVTEPVPAAAAVHRTAPGSYCTSVWLELADHWDAWRRTHRRIVLCDTDPRTGRSHVALFATGEASEEKAGTP